MATTRIQGTNMKIVENKKNYIWHLTDCDPQSHQISCKIII
jgi:hypothetical protein